MSGYVGGVTTYLDRSVPELRGEHVHFCATSGGAEIHVCMSRHEALEMAEKVIWLLRNSSNDERGRVLPFGRAS